MAGVGEKGCEKKGEDGQRGGGGRRGGGRCPLQNLNV